MVEQLSSGERAKLLESVVVHTEDAVIIAAAGRPDTHDPYIVYVNPAFTRMTGYSSEEAIGRTPRMLQGSDTCVGTRALIRKALGVYRPIVTQLLNYRKDGAPFWVELSITPIADKCGTFTHWLSVQRDVTKRRELEEAQTQAQIAAAERIAIATEIQVRERVKERLAFSTTHDDLTGLHNRTFFIERISAALARSNQDRRYRYSIIHLDLDSFKRVNERLGYHIGDRVLRDIAQRIANCAGARDTIARIGDDCFGVLVDAPDTPNDVLAIAGRLLIEVGARRQNDSADVAVAASIGIVHCDERYSDAQEVMRDADTALVRARARAGNSFIVFTPDMRHEAHHELQLRNDLSNALAHGEMCLWYQPLVDIATAQVYGFEALIRWQHPTRGLVSPIDFIPIAEATGLIVEIGRWVLFEGCRMACELEAGAARPLIMSVNVASQQLLHPDFVQDVQTALRTTGLDPHSLQLEITESVFLAGPTVVGALFARLRELGVKIAFDDFGTGYSSLSYLERYQIDALKIDQSFVARIDDVSAKSEIIRMIITLAHALGVDVIAEGVETRSQCDALGSLGCTHIQGYLFSRPLPAEQATDLFGARCAHGLNPQMREMLGEVAPTALSAAGREELRLQVQLALETHKTWMGRLHAAVATGEATFDLDSVAREDLCPIGIWLNSTISETLRGMPLYVVTKARHAVFHRSMARLLAAVIAKSPSAALSLRRDGDVGMAARSLLRTLADWLAIADSDIPREPPQSPQSAKLMLAQGSSVTSASRR